MNTKIDHQKVTSTLVEYKSLSGDKHAYVCVTDWHNSEGFTVALNETGCVALFDMTHDQWAALKKAMKSRREL